MGGSSSESAYTKPRGGAALGGVQTVTIELPAAVAEALQREAKAHRKDPVRYMAEWLEDQRDYRLAVRRWKRIESGEEKTIPAEVVFKRLGLV